MADSPITVQSGDKGIDRSTTNIDSSTHSSSTVDDHSIRNTTFTDNSSRNTVIHSDDNRREKHSNISSNISISGGGGLLVGVVAVIGVIVLAMYVVRQSSERATMAPAVQGAQVAQTQVTEPLASQPSVQVPAAQQSVANQPSVQRPSSSGPSVPANTAVPPSVVAAPVAPPPSVPLAPSKPDPAIYFNIGAARPGMIAVLIVDVRRGVDGMLTQAVATALGGSDSLFKPAFVNDGMFSRVQKGESELLRELGLSADIAQVVLGTRTVTFSPVEVAGEKLTKATVVLNVRLVRPSGGFAADVRVATDIGSGFDEESATTLATENALKKLLKQMGK